MKNRFSDNKYVVLKTLLKLRLSIVFGCILFIFFILYLVQLRNITSEKEYESLSNALSRDIIHCYAVEGTYPPDLEYLEQHYGLLYDHDKFYVDYHPIASNIRPEYEIVLLK